MDNPQGPTGQLMELGSVYVATWMGEESWGEGTHVYVYVWLSPLLFTWNYHSTVNGLHPSTKWKVQKGKKWQGSVILHKVFILTETNGWGALEDWRIVTGTEREIWEAGKGPFCEHWYGCLNCSSKATENLRDQMSPGEEILIKRSQNPESREAVFIKH